MNIKSCFFFLSFYNLKIRDRAFYEYDHDITRGINFAQNESFESTDEQIYKNIPFAQYEPSGITDDIIYKNILKKNVDNQHFQMGYIIGLCLRADEDTIKIVHARLIQNYDYLINNHIYFRECLIILTKVRRKNKLLNQYYKPNVESITTNTKHIKFHQVKYNYDYDSIIDDVTGVINNYMNYDLHLRLMGLAYSYYEHADYRSERIGLMQYVNIIGLNFFYNKSYNKVALLIDIICSISNGDNITDILLNDSFKEFHYMFDKVDSDTSHNNVQYNIAKHVDVEFFMFDKYEKDFFIILLNNSNINERMYNLITSAIKYDKIKGKKATTVVNTVPAVVDEQKVIEMDMNTGIFAIGVQTIDQMNTISMEVSNNDAEQMSKVITSLKDSVDKYKKYASIGWWGKLFTSALEIQANMTIAVIDFENLMTKGSDLTNKLNNQYNSFYDLHKSLKELHNQFDDDIKTLDEYLQDPQYSDSDKQRLLRRRNDLLAAQTLSRTTAMQYEMAKNNIGILIDKFTSIEKILKPAIEMNMKLDSNQFNNISKYF